MSSFSGGGKRGPTEHEMQQLRRVFDYLAYYSEKKSSYAKLNPRLMRNSKLISHIKNPYAGVKIRDNEGNVMSEEAIVEEHEILEAEVCMCM